MLRWILLAVTVVVIASVATVAVQLIPASTSDRGPLFPASSTAKATGPKPKAVLFEPTTFEFGTLPQRTTGKHSWKVENKGKGPLELWMISSTCSCTLAKFKNGERAIVPPGETTEIDLEYETRENNGGYEKGAEIGTNDPDLQSFSLHVRGRVFPAVMAYPGNAINFSDISNDSDDHVGYVALYSKDRPDLKVVKASTSNPEQVTAEWSELPPEECKQLTIEKGIKVTIRVKSGLPLGNFREEVVVTTDHPVQPEVRLPVAGRMTGPITTSPVVLRMHQVNGKTGGRERITVAVRNSRETKFEVVKVPEGLQVEVGPLESSGGRKGRYAISVIVPPGTPAKEIEGEIVIKTDHPKADKVIIPISIWIQNAS